jgi:crotonobetaine/carnitine-CoA ligase
MMTEPTTRTIGSLLAQRAIEQPETAFVRIAGLSISYADQDRSADRWSHAFLRHGIDVGQRVAIMLDNCPSFLDCWLALARIGAIEVPVNCAYKRRQVASVLRDSRVSMVVTQRSYATVLREAAASIEWQGAVVLVDGCGERDDPGLRWMDSDEFLGHVPSGAVDRLVLPKDPVAIMSTSGTTSASKGVLLSHEHELTLAETIVGLVGLQRDDVFYNCLPLFHNAAQAMVTLSVLRAGATMVLTDRFSGSSFWDDVAEYDVTAFFCMGPMVDFLLRESSGSPRGGKSTLRRGWGIGYSDEQAAAFHERFGVTLSGGYGTTEVNLVTANPSEDPRLHTAGRPLDGFEVITVDADDQPVPAGQVGEIVVRPRRPFTTFLGYDGNPEETVQAWRNCWLHTGDAGMFDDDGYLHFVDRIKDVIRRRGENISSLDVEAAALRFPGIVACAAVAIRADEGAHEDEIYLVVVGDERGEVDERQLLAHLIEELPYFAVPRYIETAAALPMTATGKVRKIELRENAGAGRAWDRVAAGIELSGRNRAAR